MKGNRRKIKTKRNEDKGIEESDRLQYYTKKLKASVKREH